MSTKSCSELILFVLKVLTTEMNNLLFQVKFFVPEHNKHRSEAQSAHSSLSCVDRPAKTRSVGFCAARYVPY